MHESEFSDKNATAAADECKCNTLAFDVYDVFGQRYLCNISRSFLNIEITVTLAFDNWNRKKAMH